MCLFGRAAGRVLRSLCEHPMLQPMTTGGRTQAGEDEDGREDGGVVVAGRLRLTIDGVAFDLGPGDSFQFAGGDYAWRNDHDEPAVVHWIIAPPIY